jgi:hypothetical protein
LNSIAAGGVADLFGDATAAEELQREVIGFLGEVRAA